MAITLSSLVANVTRGTAVTLSPNTAVGFTGIPSTVKKIQFILQGVSASGTDDVQIQLGSGSYQTTGYTSYATSQAVSNTVTGSGGASISSFNIPTNLASAIYSGVVNLVNISGNLWVCSINIGGFSSNYFSYLINGYVTLSGALDRIQIKTSGSNTFDAGSVNIIYQ
jgi:hypothetical protein